MPKTKAIFTEIFTKSDYQHSGGGEAPILIDFENGIMKESYEKKNFIIAADKNNETKQALVATNGCIYQGAIATNTMRNYIGIRNKITNKMRFVEVDNVLLKNRILVENQEIELKNNFDQNLATKILLKNFGGKKSARTVERMERMKVNIDALKGQLENSITEAAEEPEVNTSNLNASSMEDIAPPFNKNAKQIDEIYNISEIIPQNLLDRLTEEANAIIATDQSIPVTSLYILNEIDTIKKSNNSKSPENLTKIKILIYMDALANLVKSKQRNMAKINLSKISEKIENDIRIRFSPTGSVTPIRTAFSGEKAIAYYMCLALISSSKYEININMLMADLSKTKKKINQYSNSVNAILKRGSDILSLRLPTSTQPTKKA